MPLTAPPAAFRIGRSSSPASTLTPEDERSLIRRTGDIALGGLAATGNAIDLPGSVIRDLATWLPGGPAPANPVDQLLSPFSPENRTSGRDLLRGYGAIGSRKTTGNFWGGLLVEAVLDPLTPLSGGAAALSRGGRAAKATGLFDDVTRVAAQKAGKQLGSIGPRRARQMTTLEDLVNFGGDAARGKVDDYLTKQGLSYDAVKSEPIGGLAGIGMPFRNPAKILGTGGGRSAKVADFLDKWSPNPISPGRDLLQATGLTHVSRAMNARVKEAVTPLGRELGQSLFRSQEKSRASARQKVAEYANRLQEMGHASEDKADALRRLFEMPELRDLELTNPGPEMNALLSEVDQLLGDIPDKARSLGLRLRELDDPTVNYFPRYISDVVRKIGGKDKTKAFSSFDPSHIRRYDFLTGIAGGTVSIKQIAKDAQINDLINRGVGPKALGEAIAAKFPNTVPAESQTKFARWLRKLSPETRSVGIYGNHPLQDLQARLTNAQDAVAVAEHVYEGLASPGVLRASRGPGDDAVELTQLLKGADLDVGVARKILQERLGVSERAMQRMVVDRAVADDLQRFMKGFQSPEPVNKIVQAIDSLTNLWKGSLTSPWPAFHVRNLFSGQFQNWVAGMFDSQSVFNAHRLLRGEAVKGAAEIPALQRMARERGIKTLTDEEATKLIGELAYAHSVIGKHQGEFLPQAGAAVQRTGAGIEDILSEMAGPGRPQVNAKQTAKRFAGMTEDTGWNPLQARGVGQNMETRFGPLRAGEDVGHYVEGLNRLSPFLHQLQQGIDPATAAAKVGAAQVQYANRYYTKTQQQLINRLFPFAKFTQGMVPWTIRELSERPGGKLGQTIRTINTARDPEELTPEYVAESAAVPVSGNPLEMLLGRPPQGTDRYVTGTGLPLEDAASFGGILGGDVRGAGMELLSRTNPLVKGPLEWFTGESFFQQGPMGGRDLQDQDPLVGRTISNAIGREDPVKLPGWLEHTIANSPLSRAVSTVRTLTDPRKDIGAKAANVGTGFRVTDVSPASQDAILRERSSALMRDLGAKSFQRVYFRKEDLAAMPPELQQQAMQLQALMNELARRSKERAADR